MTDQHLPRAERRRRARAAAKAARRLYDDDVALTPAWCATEADLPEARRRTHDHLIDLLGDRRTGPVSWRWWTGQEAVEALRRLREGATGEHGDYYRRIGAHLREYGGYLVIASAPGRRP